MNVEIRAGTEADLRTVVEVDADAFGWGPVEDKHVEYDRPVFEPERVLLAMEGSLAVGTAAAFSFELTLPGGLPAPVAAVSMVSVRPTHRRRGLLSALMRRQLADLHQRGEAIAILYASEATIYGRFGYGIAAWEAELEIPRSRTAFGGHEPSPGRLEAASPAEAALAVAEVWERARPAQPGWLGFSEAWRRHHLLGDPEWNREGRSELRHVLYRDGARGEVEGYVSYRVKHGWADTAPDGRVEVQHLVAVTPAAYRALWRYCLDIDLVSVIRAGRRPVEEPLRLMLADAEALRTEIHAGLWLRVVDVPAALSRRRYPAEGRLVISVADGLCGWNGGIFSLESEGGQARCRRSELSPDLMLDAAALGAAYLGGTPFRVLVAAGLVEEARAGAAARADAMFAAERPPWCPVAF